MGTCSTKTNKEQNKKNNIKDIEPRSSNLKDGVEHNITNSPNKIKFNIVRKNTNRIRDEYKIWTECIGKGAFGEVRKALHLQSGIYRAIKIIYKSQASPEEQKKILNEIEVLRNLDHPNIVKIYEYFEDENFIYIVMELITGGELFDKIVAVHHFNEKKASEYFFQILNGVNYLHKNHIVHRDLKPENIVFDGKVLKIIDFGTSKMHDNAKNMKRCHGTPYYIAPEILKGSYDQKCDVWSCGVILYIMLSGYPPFNGRNDDDILKSVKSGRYSFDFPEFKYVSIAAKNLIKKMLAYKPEERPTIEELIVDDWFKEARKIDSELNTNIMSNLKNFSIKNKMQHAIYYFLVNHLASKEEMNELLSTFKALDTNNDGVVSRDELLEGFKKINNALTEADINSMMKKIDNNNSDAIDYTEFVAAAIDKKNLLSEEKIKACFNMLDKDKSNKISVKEFKDMFSGNELVDENVWEDFIKDADENKDGEIDFDEFRGLLLKMIE